MIESGTGGTLFLQNSGSPVSVTVPQGSHVLLAPVSLSGDATFDIDGTLAINGGFAATTIGTITHTGAGSLNLASTLTFPSGEAFVASSGTTNFNSNAKNLAVTVTNATVNFNAAQNIAALTVNSGGMVGATGSNIVVNAASVSVVGGNIDVAGNALIARSGTLGSLTANVYSGLTGSIQTGRNGGAWNGNGIITSMTSAKMPNPLTTLGIAKASDALHLTSLLKTTSQARANPSIPTRSSSATPTPATRNLDGEVNADDYFPDRQQLLTIPQATLRLVPDGDFNYGGRDQWRTTISWIDNAFA